MMSCLVYAVLSYLCCTACIICSLGEVAVHVRVSERQLTACVQSLRDRHPRASWPEWVCCLVLLAVAVVQTARLQMAIAAWKPGHSAYLPDIAFAVAGPPIAPAAAWLFQVAHTASRQHQLLL